MTFTVDHGGKRTPNELDSIDDISYVQIGKCYISVDLDT